VFLATAKGDVPGFQLKDEQKLYQVAMDFGVEIGDRSVKEIAIDVGHKAVAEFGRQEGEPLFIKRAPLKRQEIWKKLGITPGESTGRSSNSCTGRTWAWIKIIEAS